ICPLFPVPAPWPPLLCIFIQLHPHQAVCQVSVCFFSWFAGAISRLEAEQRLCWQDPGVFLVRASESAPGEFSLSVRSVNAPHL
uniref:SH2 domain-containing protein n=1 Tax=Xiphophorus couchianus TaxID=32473 RepID=A0A3B5LA82_9TELE